MLGFPAVDAGDGWLIFELPPAELAVHPAGESGACELYLMCDDVQAEGRALNAKGVQCSDVTEAGWGAMIHFRMPGGGEVGLYQPRHRSPATPPGG